eukprot:827344-Lingulodinium_polyedra.AAC.1
MSMPAAAGIASRASASCTPTSMRRSRRSGSVLAVSVWRPRATSLTARAALACAPDVAAPAA